MAEIPLYGDSPDNSFRSDHDQFLPIANVSRIMKKSLPLNAKISKEAKESVQGCVSEFISFITGEASERCQREKRKTINGDDLLWAMSTLGFENYIQPLESYLSKFRETEGEKNSMARVEDHPLSSAAANRDSSSFGESSQKVAELSSSKLGIHNLNFKNQFNGNHETDGTGYFFVAAHQSYLSK